MERLFSSAVKDLAEYSAKKLNLTLYYLHVQNELVNYENQGLREALQVKKKQSKKRRTLNLQHHQEYHSGAVLWSPRKLREARVRQRVKESLEAEEMLEKANAKELKHATKL